MLQLQQETPEQEAHRLVRTRVIAGMETGNHGVARSALIEYEAISPEGARAIRTELVGAYGTGL